LNDVINIESTTELPQSPRRIRQLLLLEKFASSASPKESTSNVNIACTVEWPDKTVTEGAREDVVVRPSYSGFHTHDIDMGARTVQLEAVLSFDGDDLIDVTSPFNPSIMPPGVCMLWVVEKEIPSEAVCMKLEL
jgi:hypothetical protein